MDVACMTSFQPVDPLRAVRLPPRRRLTTTELSRRADRFSRAQPYCFRVSAHWNADGPQDRLLDLHHPAWREIPSDRPWDEAITTERRDLLALRHRWPLQAALSRAQSHVGRCLTQYARNRDDDDVAGETVAAVGRYDERRTPLAPWLIGDAYPVQMRSPRMGLGRTHSSHARRAASSPRDAHPSSSRCSTALSER